MIKSEFTINGEVWTDAQLERIEYERQLHILHKMKQLGATIKDGGKILTDDDIDYLTADKARKISVNTRAEYGGTKTQKLYKEQLERASQFWRSLPFAQDKPMEVSRTHMKVSGVSLQDYLQMIKGLQTHERMLLESNPEHFLFDSADEKMHGIEPFGMFGTPTLCELHLADISELGKQIQDVKDPEYPMSMAGRAYLPDTDIEINCPYHQFKPTADGFEAKLSVFWPENTPKELVNGHEIHLAVEFYEGLKSINN